MNATISMSLEQRTNSGKVGLAIVFASFAFLLPSRVSADPSTQFVDLSGLPTPVLSSNSSSLTLQQIDLTVSSEKRPIPSSQRGSRVHSYFYDLTTSTRMELIANSERKDAEDIADEAADPWEGFNRSHFGSHVFLNTEIIDPMEQVYMGVTPNILRKAMHNFLSNLEAPKIFVNDALQIDIRNAGAITARFLLNSSIGVAGTLDIATPIGLPFHDNDFGKTLAVYGVGDRPYLLVPVVGPSNPRDLGGKIVDIFLDPLEYITIPGGIYTSIGHAAVSQLDKRSADTGRLRTLVQTSADPYAAERHEARARRQAEIEGEDTNDGD